MAGPALLLEVPPAAAEVQAVLMQRLAAMALGGAATLLARGVDGAGRHVTVVAFSGDAARGGFLDLVADLRAVGLVARPLALAAGGAAESAPLFP